MPEDVQYNLAAADVAVLFGVHRATVKRWANTGHLPGIRIPGGAWRFRRTDVDAFAQQQREATVATLPEAG